MIRSLARRIVLDLPPVRRLLSAQAAGVARMTLDAVLAAAGPGAFLRVNFNHTELDLPVETLRTMVHCIYPQPDRSLVMEVEYEHLAWMMSHLAPGGTFLDVGAATGATTLPVARRFGGAVGVIAYEPASAARGLLAATLARNDIGHVTLREAAVSDAEGEAEFREFLPDETTPWQPETSALTGGRMADSPSRVLRVPVVTLDGDALPRVAGAPVVVKVDVEGFEVHVLRGAARLLAGHRPHLSIDVHVDPFGDGSATTEPGLRAILEPLGYALERQGHVLLCTPGPVA